ncbi:efflux RND transporter periplasmic adaptor subunit, partial [bacterium]|nr:efflux RND transporter periplasmic adaptor subunit [bacterium]
IKIPDPLDLNQHFEDRIPLLIGEFVKTELVGKTESDVYVILREALRENDTIWVLSDSNTLDILDIEIIWRDTEIILARGLPVGVRLIVSDLSGPVQNMALTLTQHTSTGALQ